MTTINLIGILTYSCWRVWIIKDRAEKFNISAPRVASASELIYTLLMVYLLIVSPSTFLITAFISLFIHCILGFYVEIFKPEQKRKENNLDSVLEKFWYFLLADTVVTLGCFLATINFGS